MNVLNPDFPPQGSKRKVLVIDDAATVRQYHRLLVEQAGHEAHQAFNGMEALERAVMVGFDLFLVDVNMPEMDGYRFVAEVRRHPELKAIPAIMISTEAKPADEERAFAAGANYYLVKPVKPDQMAACLQLVIGGGLG